MSYFLKSVPILFLTIIYGFIDTFILNFSIFGEGSDPPVAITLRDIIILHLVLPIILYFLVFLFYKSICRLSTKVCIITTAIYYLMFEIWIMIVAIYYNGKV